MSRTFCVHGEIRNMNTEFYSEILSRTRYLENLSVTVGLSKILNFAFTISCLKFSYYNSNQRKHTVLLTLILLTWRIG